MWLTKRGVESLIIDQPGTGEATRLCGLATRFDSDHWVRVVMDWLEPGSNIVARQIGMEGGP